MARPHRINFEGALFHAMSRGNGGQEIFLDRTDFEEFLRILHQTSRRCPFKLYAYCLMPNHFHLLIRIGHVSLSRIMQTVLTRYASYFNRERHRKGHLFQGRFKAILCANDPYLMTLVRYIHLNPVRAGLVKNPSDWPWSGHEQYLGENWTGLVDTAMILSMLSSRADVSRTSYERFVQEGIVSANDSAPILSRSVASPIVPEQIAPKHPEQDFTESAETVEQIGTAVAAETGTALTAICGPSQAHSLSKIRRLLIHRALRRGIPPSELAKFLNRSAALITKHSRS